MKTEERLEMAKNFIKRRGIEDEDLIQDLYLIALETDCTDSKSKQQKIYLKLKRRYDKEVSYKQQIIDSFDILENCIIDVNLDDSVFHDELSEKLLYCIDNITVSPRDKIALKYMFGLLDGETHTLVDVGREFNISAVRARQIIAKCLRKLRYRCYFNDLKLFLDPEDVHINFTKSFSSQGKRFR